MASNSFGKAFQITTWGESHGKAIGVIVDGCPAGLKIDQSHIQKALNKRKPGSNSYTSPRKESDQVQILSGTFEDISTGAPISLLIENQDVRSKDYSSLKNVLRPGHSDYTYRSKYGLHDYRGGGRSSARETAARVAAAAVADSLLDSFNIQCICFIKQIGTARLDTLPISSSSIEHLEKSHLFCLTEDFEKQCEKVLDEAISEHDSLGGVVECHLYNLPVGLGEPIYYKVEAKLAEAMLSLPASKGFEIGEGFHCVTMKGSEHNDTFALKEGKTYLTSNHAGGTLGGISTGEPLVFRVAFKPTSSIGKQQQTVDIEKNTETTLDRANFKRHDPCVAIRGVPCVAAMAKLVIADLLLLAKMQAPEKNLSKKREGEAFATYA